MPSLPLNAPDPSMAAFWLLGGTDEATWDAIAAWINQGNHILDVLGYLIFWQHDRSQTIPHATWTPLAFNNLRVTGGGTAAWTPNDFGAYVPASTTIAVGSNGAALPQATINVLSTAGFTTKGYIVIQIGGTDRVVQYTGITATSFTGCLLGVGTMTTGDQVRQANVGWNPPSHSSPSKIGSAIGEVAWANAADGIKRGIRVRTWDNTLNLGGGTVTAAAIPGAGTPSDPFHHMQTVEQPANVPNGHNRIEVFQSRSVAATLDSVIGEGLLDAPRLVAFSGPSRP